MSVDGEKYTLQLNQKILEEIDPNLRDFYEQQKKMKNRYFRSEYESTVTDIVQTLFNGITEPDAIAALYTKKRVYRAKKKKRLAESVLIDVKSDFDDRKYPYKDVVRLKLQEERWKEVYGTHTFEEVIESKLKELEAWRVTRNSKMTECPVLNTFTEKAIFSAFELDIFFEAHKVISEVFKKGTEELLKPYVDEMTKGPYFTNSRKKYPLAGDDSLVTIIPMSEDGASRLIVEVNEELLSESGSFKMMDAKDKDILSYVLDLTSKNVNAVYQTGRMLVELYPLAKIVSGNDRPSGAHYEEAKERCYRMANSTYNKYVDGKQVGAINFLDHAEEVIINNRQYISIAVGGILLHAVINNKISRLPAPAYEKLDSNTAKLLYFHLQKGRILLAQQYGMDDKIELKTTYSYNDFLAMMNFGTSRKTRNFNIVCDALAEYVEKGEIIKDFVPKRSSFTVDVYFYPLSEKEKRDVKKYNIISDEVKEVVMTEVFSIEN